MSREKRAPNRPRSLQVSHLQEGALDGDTIRGSVDDWGEFQLRTTKGWQATSRPLFCVPWLFLNLQPAHHLFPALHHSKLHLIVPLIREAYPGLMEDHDVTQLVGGMLDVLTRRPQASRVYKAQRCDCGWPGITVQQCEALPGPCLFDHSDQRQPHCFVSGQNTSHAQSCPKARKRPWMPALKGEL